MGLVVSNGLSSCSAIPEPLLLLFLLCSVWLYQLAMDYVSHSLTVPQRTPNEWDRAVLCTLHTLTRVGHGLLVGWQSHEFPPFSLLSFLFSLLRRRRHSSLSMHVHCALCIKVCTVHYVYLRTSKSSDFAFVRPSVRPTIRLTHAPN